MRAARPKAAIAVVAVAALAVAGCAESDRDNEGSGQSTKDTLVFGTAATNPRHDTPGYRGLT